MNEKCQIGGAHWEAVARTNVGVGSNPEDKAEHGKALKNGGKKRTRRESKPSKAEETGRKCVSIG